MAEASRPIAGPFLQCQSTLSEWGRHPSDRPTPSVHILRLFLEMKKSGGLRTFLSQVTLVDVPTVGDLMYQETRPIEEAEASGERLTLKLRHRQSDGDESQPVERP